jgi:Uma2 family endonuclease
MTLSLSEPATVPATPDDDRLPMYEIVDGEHLEKPMSWMSQWVGHELGRLVGNHLADDFDDRPGWVNTEAYVACFDWKPGDRRRPDVAYWRIEDLPEPPDRGDTTIAPAWCVEVVSPGDAADSLEVKIAEYFRAGVSLVWVIYPQARTIHSLRSDGSACFYRDGETADAAPVLPGLSVPVAKLFPKPAADA